MDGERHRKTDDEDGENPAASRNDPFNGRLERLHSQ